MNKLLILLTDPLKTYYKKGEIKERYYNPKDFFDEIHMVSFCEQDISVQEVVGKAKLVMHPVKNFIQIYQIMKKVRPDFIRAYDSSVRGCLAVWFGKRFNIPSVISIHCEMDEQRRFDKRPILHLRKLFENYSISNANQIICVTDYVKEYAIRHGAKRATTIYNKVVLNYPPTDKIFRRKTILSVGRLENQKRQDILIQAIKGLDVDLVLIGDGSQRKELEIMALGQRVFFLGSIPNKDIHKYYNSCDVFAIATDYEGFCIPIIEAMAAGKPIVASNIPPIREILGNAGRLVDNSESSFREVIRDILRNPWVSYDLSRNALTRVAMFGSDIIEEQEKSVYEKIRNI